MTISQSDYDRYQSKVSQFDRQNNEDTCLLIGLKNILDELNNRVEDSELEFERDDLEDICDYYPGFGCSAEFLPQQLEAELTRHNVEKESERELDDLDQIISSESKSYPLVELDQQYFEEVDSYQVQSGTHGRKLPHIVIPFKINSDRVLFFDPYEDFYEIGGENGAPPKELTKTKFFELWSGRAEKRWTLWIERPEQRTLGATNE